MSIDPLKKQYFAMFVTHLIGLAISFATAGIFAHDLGTKAYEDFHFLQFY